MNEREAMSPNTKIEDVAEFVARSIGWEVQDNGRFHPRMFTTDPPKCKDPWYRPLADMARVSARASDSALWMLRGVMWQVAAQHPDRAQRLEQRLKLEVGRRIHELRPLVRRKRRAGERCHEEENDFFSLYYDGIRGLDGELILRNVAAVLADPAPEQADPWEE